MDLERRKPKLRVPKAMYIHTNNTSTVRVPAYILCNYTETCVQWTHIGILPVAESIIQFI